MDTLVQLYNWFYLDQTCENTKISNCKNNLWVAPIKYQNSHEWLKINDSKYAFAEKNKDGNVEYFHGLNRFLVIEKENTPPMFIFDNHNHAPVFWYFTIKQYYSYATTLIHIDQHSDSRENANELNLDIEKDELDKVFHFYNEKCNVWNFITPSLQSWLISSQIQVRSISALQKLTIKNGRPYILDIDLDFCLKWINRNKIDDEIINILKNKFDELYNSMLCITIATSPYFLNQDLAIDIINTILSK